MKTKDLKDVKRVAGPFSKTQYLKLCNMAKEEDRTLGDLVVEGMVLVAAKRGVKL